MFGARENVSQSLAVALDGPDLPLSLRASSPSFPFPLPFPFHFLLSFPRISPQIHLESMRKRYGQWLGTNLIHDFTAVTFSVKLTSFREKR